MKRILAALVVLSIVPGLAPALEIKNIRPCYGQFGSLRTTTKFVQGDLLYMTYDIDNLALDAKTGKASYDTRMEIIDDKQAVKFERKYSNDVVPELGGARMPGELVASFGTAFPPGKYTVKLTVTDKLAKQSKAFLYSIEVVPLTLGFIHVEAPAVGLTNQTYRTLWGLVGFVPDPKTKKPNVEITIRILDQNGKPVARETKIVLPADLPMGLGDAPEVIPISLPIYLNRTGQFEIDIVAVDKNAKNAQIQMRSPFTVVDIPMITGNK
jgi:hypothetical protein